MLCIFNKKIKKNLTVFSVWSLLFSLFSNSSNGSIRKLILESPEVLRRVVRPITSSTRHTLKVMEKEIFSPYYHVVRNASSTTIVLEKQESESNMSSKIETHLVRNLIQEQFPQWKDLEIVPIVPGGWDNRTFRLGRDKLVRLPSAEAYAVQVEKEQTWLPRLAPYLPLSIPEPIGLGVPGYGYPWHWSIYRWIEGEAASSVLISDKREIATRLGEFLRALHSIDIDEGPVPSNHNFFRGGDLSIYDKETRRALQKLDHAINPKIAQAIWEEGLSTQWESPPVWVHGDLSPGNLLLQNGRLTSVIDFGMLSVGDPACDLAIAWTYFDKESRSSFIDLLQLDKDTWNRGRAWVLWKYLIVASGISDTNEVEKNLAWGILNQLLEAE